jgi:hypothetical protein
MVQAMTLIAARPVPTKFAYALSLNSRRCQPIAQSAEDQRQTIVANFAERDGTGKPVVVAGQYRIADAAGFAALWRDVTDEPVDVDLHLVDFASLPDTIEPGLLDALSPMIRG